MSRCLQCSILTLGLLVAGGGVAQAQVPYVGFMYPAGGQQGTTVQVRLGGQRLDGMESAIVSGKGVTAKLVEYRRRINNQDLRFLREQLGELKKKTTEKTPEVQALMQRVQTRIKEYVNRPACTSISSLTLLEVTVAPHATPGVRDLRLVTARGVSNPLPFHVGQVPEVARAPMVTATFQVLGKENLAQRKRPPEEEEVLVTLPCTMNGQIASGEINKYRFAAKKGQRLVASVRARQLVPYIADAVPGWFQPVIFLHDAEGKEVAFSDDYRFDPDPTLHYEVAKDGEYVLTITDAIFRGREDFVYRISLGEQPFVTSIFPLGGKVGKPAVVTMEGWNLQQATLALPPADAKPGLHRVVANREGAVSNPVLFALDTLPECLENDANNDPAHAQVVKLPIIVNGRSDAKDDQDVFRFEGKAGQTVVAEVQARRLLSPMDSILRITDAAGKLLAVNDDTSDPGSGLNTHHADSYLRVKLPADGAYFVHLADTARSGGKEYAYRLRISWPRPDFELRIQPSSVSMRSKSAGNVTVYAIRKDGYKGPIPLFLQGAGSNTFTAAKATIGANQEKARFTIKTVLKDTRKPVPLRIVGKAKIGEKQVTHRAVASEDRMQAFLWRHLVPTEEFYARVFNPGYKKTPKHPAPVLSEEKLAEIAAKPSSGEAKFSKKQLTNLLRQLKRMYEEEGLLTDAFYLKKLTEYETSLQGA